MNRPAPTRSPFRINVWRESMKPARYAYTIFRDVDHAVLAVGDARTAATARKDAQARIRQLEAAP